MYNDDRGTKRDGWVYTYKGSDLLKFAKEKLAFHLAEEAKARKFVSDKIMTARNDDEEIKKNDRNIAIHGNIREQCEVYVHEFTRTPERDFLLSLGDVVFFGLNAPEAK